MLRWSIATLLALVAAPSQAAVQLGSSWLFLSAVSDNEDFEPGLTSIDRSFGFSDIGGCEDEEDGPCGGYETGRLQLKLANNSVNYAASIQQSQAISFNDPDTMIEVYAVFRAGREMRFSIVESRLVTVSRCVGTCLSTLKSLTEQTRLNDGSWQLSVNLATSSSVHEASQIVSHGFRMAVAEVPEPDNWALMIAGFGLVGAAGRHQRRGTARAAVCHRQLRQQPLSAPAPR